MSDLDLQETVQKNLREFQKMSYSDVSTMIWQGRFEEAKSKYKAVYQSLECNLFDAALDISITTTHDELLAFMSDLAGSVAEPEKISAVGFDLSWHALYQDDDGICDQGVEVNLYSSDSYDFTGANDDELKTQCQEIENAWQGSFMEMSVMPLAGLGYVAKQFYDFAISNQDQSIEVIEASEGSWVVNPDVIARHVAKLLLAIEYHEYMAAFVAQVDVPSKMVFVIGEHDEMEVPVVFYRAEPNMAVNVNPDENPITSSMSETTLSAEETPPMYDDVDASHELEAVASNEQEAGISHEPEAQALHEPEQPLDEAEQLQALKEKREAKKAATAEAPLTELQEPKEPIMPEAKAGSESLESLEASQILPEQAIENNHQEVGFERVDSKTLIGLPLKAKAFGQRLVAPADQSDTGTQ